MGFYSITGLERCLNMILTILYIAIVIIIHSAKNNQIEPKLAIYSLIPVYIEPKAVKP